MSESSGFHFGGFPAGVMILNDGGAGSLNCRSKTARSFLIVGEPNESTIAIVWPLPVMPCLYDRRRGRRSRLGHGGSRRRGGSDHANG
jgi:hypothetical protein